METKLMARRRNSCTGIARQSFYNRYMHKITFLFDLQQSFSIEAALLSHKMVEQLFIQCIPVARKNDVTNYSRVTCSLVCRI